MQKHRKIQMEGAEKKEKNYSSENTTSNEIMIFFLGGGVGAISLVAISLD
jgi:hypothetical protein